MVRGVRQGVFYVAESAFEKKSYRHLTVANGSRFRSHRLKRDVTESVTHPLLWHSQQGSNTPVFAAYTAYCFKQTGQGQLCCPKGPQCSISIFASGISSFMMFSIGSYQCKIAIVFILYIILNVNSVASRFVLGIK